MNLLAAALYDPAGAVSKSTASLIAMTAFDTTNLRLAITVPAHGLVRFRLRCTYTGATTVATVLLGVLNGATVVGRVAPMFGPFTANATTQDYTFDAEFTATGLTPGAMNVDAAYGVEVVVAATNIKYGGPNNTTGNDAWGAFVFEAWDPRPMKLALDGGVNVTQWNGTAVSAPATAGIPDVNVKNINNVAAATPGAAGGLFIAGTNAATTITTGLTTTFTGNLTGSVASVTGAVGSVTGAVGSVTARVTANTDQLAGQAVTAAAGVTFPSSVASPTNITAGTITTATNLTNAPTAGDFTATMKTSIGTAVAASAVASVTAAVTVGTISANVITAASLAADAGAELADAVWDELLVGHAGIGSAGLALTSAGALGTPLDAAGVRAAVGLASANLDTQIAAVKADTAAVKVQTDKMVFTVANKLDVNLLYVNGVQVNGSGTVGAPWGP